MRASKDIRIFFALWPPDGVRERLSAAAKGISIEPPMRPVPETNLHVTLHFIGNVTFDQMACLQQAARRVPFEAFELVIDSRGHFARPRVAWLGCSRLPPALTQLHERLGARLSECGYRVEKRRYHPHVTIIRKCRQAPAAAEFEPIKWPVSDFVLIESNSTDRGVKYEILERYPLP